MRTDLLTEDEIVDAAEVRCRYDASVLAGSVALGAIIVLGMVGVVLVWAAMQSCHSAVHP